ncbi:POTRA domain-containing protein [Portibacter marinus]|uniref:POTRA domain-containing protein n=1 Tax=Portibacter marinus TaxID=2898660 RepID=UPI001F3CAE0A|nr:POTRA domain-containing protein [Portibacter marinus]
MKTFGLIVFIFLYVNAAIGQTMVINSINIEGNKRTRKKVILRELNFKVGTVIEDSSDLVAIEDFNEKRLLSIGLFNEVEVNMNGGDVQITVNENWYIFPNPIFELADDNFNFWWFDQMRDLSRTNYGLRAEHVNLTGNRDKLVMTFQLGYRRKLELNYRFPFLDREGRWGSAINAFYDDQRELHYKTVGNKPLFTQVNDEIVRTSFRLGGDISHRPNIFLIHNFRLEFRKITIHPVIAQEFNPDYFLDGKTDTRYFLLDYLFAFDRREFKIFPEKGDYIRLNLRKEGLYVFDEVNNLSAELKYERNYNYLSKLIYGYEVKGKYQLLRNQLAFVFNEAISGADVLRGYDRFTINGSDYVFAKMDVHYKLVNHTFDISNWLKLSQFNKINLKLYLGMGFDTGYVNERFYLESNTFNNRWLYGYGPTFSIMFYNTYLFQVDYSWNHLGQGSFAFKNAISF